MKELKKENDELYRELNMWRSGEYYGPSRRILKSATNHYRTAQKPLNNTT